MANSILMSAVPATEVACTRRASPRSAERSGTTPDSTEPVEATNTASNRVACTCRSCIRAPRHEDLGFRRLFHSLLEGRGGVRTQLIAPFGRQGLDQLQYPQPERKAIEIAHTICEHDGLIQPSVTPNGRVQPHIGLNYPSVSHVPPP